MIDFSFGRESFRYDANLDYVRNNFLNEQKGVKGVMLRTQRLNVN